MALLHLQSSVPVIAVSTRPVALSSRSRHYVRARITAHKLPNQPSIRRSADYQPTIWSFEHIQSLKTGYTEESFKRRINKLKEDVNRVIVMLEGKEMDKDPLHQPELIDLQRLGLSYHFENEIARILERVYNNNVRN
ncbi:hypothetical protein SLE2022_207680 [Rubroshorea leprosula]